MPYADKIDFTYNTEKEINECSIGFKLSSGFGKSLRIVNGRIGYRCVKCKTDYTKGRYVGTGYCEYKICIKCIRELCLNAFKDIEEIKKGYESILNDYNKHKSKWTREAIINKLK